MDKLKLKKLYPEINMAWSGTSASKQEKHDSIRLFVCDYICFGNQKSNNKTPS